MQYEEMMFEIQPKFCSTSSISTRYVLSNIGASFDEMGKQYFNITNLCCAEGVLCMGLLSPVSFWNLQLSEPVRIVHPERGADLSHLCWLGCNESVTHVWYEGTALYTVRAIERVPAGSCHFPCLTDPSQSVVSFPCVWK